LQKVPTTLEYSILGLISLGKASGYDIHRIFADSPMGQYSSSPGSIYPALDRLANRGLLTAEFDPKQNMRRRKTFALTSLGEHTLHCWLAEAVTLEEIQSDIRTSLLRFSFMGGNRTTNQVIAYLESFREHLKTYLADLQARRKTFREMTALYAYLAMDNGVRAIRSHIRWVESTRNELLKRDK